MTSSMKKTLLVSLILFIAIVAAVGVIYMVRKPAPITTNPTPQPTATPLASPAAAEVFVVTTNACSLGFTIPCVSTSPSPSPSGSPSPSPSASAPVFPSSSPSAPPQANLDCVTKRMYTDDSRNRAGFYYLENQITDANTIQDGQVIVYNVLARNNGVNSAPDTTITDKLSANLTYVDGDSSCSYDSGTRIVTCTVGALSGTSEAQRSFRARVSVTGTASVSNTAEVSSTNGQRDSCSVQISATGQVIVPPSSAPTALPVAGVFEVTAGTLGIGMILLLAGALGLLLI